MGAQRLQEEKVPQCMFCLRFNDPRPSSPPPTVASSTSPPG
jgi:hypothetical protein